jgi:hypothetical protein
LPQNGTRILALTLAASMSSAACADSASPSEPNVMTAQIHGADFRANDHLGVPMAAISSDGTNVEIRGFARSSTGTTQEITIRIHRYAGPGTYRLAVPDSGGMAYYEYRLNTESEPLHYFTRENVSGSVTIDSVNTSSRMIAGRFAFMSRLAAGSEALITDGAFRGRYVQQ